MTDQNAEQTITIARCAGATHRDTRQPNKFYRFNRNFSRLELGFVEDGHFTGWLNSWMTNPPEWSSRI